MIIKYHLGEGLDGGLFQNRVKYFLQLIIFLLLTFSYSSAYSADKLVVLLDWFANPNHAPLFVAQQQGFFKQQNLDVELIGPADPADPPKLVAAGKADIAITYQPNFIEQVDQGLPLISIGTLIDHPLNSLVVLKNNSIKTIADLKGKRIGASNGDINSLALKTMLENHGLHLSDVHQVNIHYNLMQALLSKKVDAITGMSRNVEIVQMELTGHPVLAFFPEKNGMPNYSELIFIVNTEKMHDPRIARFLKALQQGVTYLKSHPEESWKQFAKTHPDLNDEVNHRIWLITLPYFATDPTAFNEKEWMAFVEFMLNNGVIKKVYPVSRYHI